MEVSFNQPVYSMVTESPFLGMGPAPSEMIVLVTPMILGVCEKFLRDVERNVRLWVGWLRTKICCVVLPSFGRRKDIGGGEEGRRGLYGGFNVEWRWL